MAKKTVSHGTPRTNRAKAYQEAAKQQTARALSTRADPTGDCTGAEPSTEPVRSLQDAAKRLCIGYTLLLRSLDERASREKIATLRSRAEFEIELAELNSDRACERAAALKSWLTSTDVVENQ